ncbi:hypothetical protein SLEP1_g13335 [Rubroshorea leprosula]|uniref:Uncharacterized protein n=1 Tax=Rubroshorea leprosula TaxID=152421 RepID=A0AAV5IFI8_9ROSI|nr:hypothetical protein SLEP1_g13335 [Rubroshorea leprosula]
MLPMYVHMRNAESNLLLAKQSGSPRIQVMPFGFRLHFVSPADVEELSENSRTYRAVSPFGNKIDWRRVTATI